MHEIDRTDAFTLMGADARRGKLTLFAADGPREPGPLARISFHAPGRREERARRAGRADLPASRAASAGRPGTSRASPCGSPTRGGAPRARRARLYDDEAGTLRAGDAVVRLERGHVARPSAPLLNHLGAEGWPRPRPTDEEAKARDRDRRRRDGPNTLAVLHLGPARGEARVRRAQADVLARMVSPYPTWWSRGPAWPASPRPPGRPARRRASRFFEKADRAPAAAPRLSSGYVWRYRYFERYREECPARRRGSCSASSRRGSTRPSTGWWRSARRPHPRDTGNPLTSGGLRPERAGRRARPEAAGPIGSAAAHRRCPTRCRRFWRPAASRPAASSSAPTSPPHADGLWLRGHAAPAPDDGLRLGLAAAARCRTGWTSSTAATSPRRRPASARAEFRGAQQLYARHATVTHAPRRALRATPGPRSTSSSGRPASRGHARSTRSPTEALAERCGSAPSAT